MPFLKAVKAQREPSLTRSVPFSREKVRRAISYFIFFLILVSIFFNILFFSKYQHIRNMVANTEKNVHQTLQQREKPNLLESNAPIIFAQHFLETYLNIAKDPAQRENREKELKTYFIQNFDPEFDQLKDFKGERTVKDITFLERKQTSSQLAELHFLIEYEITSPTIEKQKATAESEPVMKDVEVPKSFQRVNEVIVPITTDGKGFAVTDHPVILSVRDMASSIDYKPEGENPGNPIGTQEREALEGFLSEYFKAFTENNVNQLSYMTANPRGLANYTFVAIDKSTFSKSDDHYYADIKVTLKDQDSQIPLNQHYQFTLVKKDGRFYITKDQ